MSGAIRPLIPRLSRSALVVYLLLQALLIMGHPCVVLAARVDRAPGTEQVAGAPADLPPSHSCPLCAWQQSATATLEAPAAARLLPPPAAQPLPALAAPLSAGERRLASSRGPPAS